MIPGTFESNPNQFTPFTFEGINVNRTRTGYFTEQEHYAKTIELLKPQVTFDEFK